MECFADLRDIIYRSMSIPQLASQLVAQIRFSLHIPADDIPAVIASATGLLEQDFHKDRNTPDRLWAETCYMKWWLTQGHETGDDATFFAEESFGFDKLLHKLEQASRDMRNWRQFGPTANLTLAELFENFKDLHNCFSRLVACYLIYRNGSRKRLSAEANKFGIEIDGPNPGYPLGYWIIYVVVLIISVYVGVSVSAIAYDVLSGQGFDLTQDFDRTIAWIMYSLSNYGLAIVTILLVRYLLSFTGTVLYQTHLDTYCWTFLLAFVVGPLGLTFAVHNFGESRNTVIPIYELYFAMLRWGVGPAFVSVYISYYIDRQTCPDLPNINHSRATIVRRLVNCCLFTSVTLLFLLPPLLAINAQPGSAWDTAKLRFVAAGTTFCLTFALALAAQFALREGTPETGSILSPPAAG